MSTQQHTRRQEGSTSGAPRNLSLVGAGLLVFATFNATMSIRVGQNVQFLTAVAVASGSAVSIYGALMPWRGGNVGGATGRVRLRVALNGALSAVMLGLALLLADSFTVKLPATFGLLLQTVVPVFVIALTRAVLGSGPSEDELPQG